MTERSHDPDPSRSGPDVEAAVARAEEGSAVEGVHGAAPPDQGAGESRLEQLRGSGQDGEQDGVPG
jgi:hypothetical protein